MKIMLHCFMKNKVNHVKSIIITKYNIVELKKYTILI